MIYPFRLESLSETTSDSAQLDHAIDSTFFESFEDFQRRIEEAAKDNSTDNPSPEFESFDEFKTRIRASLNDEPSDTKKEGGDVLKYFLHDPNKESLKNEVTLESEPQEKERLIEFGVLEELERDREKFKDIKYDIYKELYSTIGGPNCFAYAMGWTKNPITGEKFIENPCPGELSGYNWGSAEQDMLRFGSEESVKKLLTERWASDCSILGKELIEVENADYKPKEGERLVSLMYTEGGPETGFAPDFHFMVKGEYGNFLHKPGVSPVTAIDDSGNIISDPAKCDSIYNHHLGYFVIKERG